MRLIDADALRNTILLGTYDTRSKIVSAIDNAPTVSPALPTEVKKALEVLKVMKQGKWVPVSEKLPPNYIICLFCDIDGDIFYGHRTYENNWYAANINDEICGVVAWQELPEPYKEGNNE